MMTASIPELDAPIVPGVSAAGILIGGDIKSLPGLSRADPSEYGFHKVQGVKVWSRRGHIFQVGVLQGYRGLIDGRIGIGSTIGEVEDWFGCKVVEGKYDSLVASGSEGWSFFVEPTSREHRNVDHDARVTSIWVHSSTLSEP